MSTLFERSRVMIAFITGQERDPGKLTSMIFHARHPELGGRKIEKREKTLANEWHAIKRDVVKPALDSMGFGGVDDSDLKRARWIWKAPVPGHTGLTVAQLVEKYRPTICPEVPLPILIAFIHRESRSAVVEPEVLRAGAVSNAGGTSRYVHRTERRHLRARAAG
jgi:hypothetical protein